MNKVQAILLLLADGDTLMSSELGKRTGQSAKAASIRCNTLKHRGDIAIVREKHGTVGALFRITPKGMRRVELLRETGDMPSDDECVMTVVESALLARHPLTLAWASLNG